MTTLRKLLAAAGAVALAATPLAASAHGWHGGFHGRTVVWRGPGWRGAWRGPAWYGPWWGAWGAPVYAPGPPVYEGPVYGPAYVTPEPTVTYAPPPRVYHRAVYHHAVRRHVVRRVRHAAACVTAGHAARRA